MNVYVYYRVPPAGRSGVAARVRAMQATLDGHAHRIRLMRRPGEADGMQTWMEIYEDVAPAFEALLDAAVAAHGLVLAPHPRHVERFVPVPAE